MSYDGNGTFVPTSDYDPVVSGQTITDELWLAMVDDLAAGLTNAVTKDGQTTPTANLPMGGFKLTGLGSGASSTDSVNYGQVFNNPTFINPVRSASLLTTDNSLSLATTAFVQAIALGAQQYAGLQVYTFQNF